MDLMTITATTTGLPMACDTCGAPSIFIWYGWDGKPVRCCSAHNPMLGPLLMNLVDPTTCPTCGK
jgi:hypothetical protein